MNPKKQTFCKTSNKKAIFGSKRLSYKPCITKPRYNSHFFCFFTNDVILIHIFLAKQIK